MPLPIQFDENEWFILLLIVLGFSWVLFFPKRYPRAISILVILFTVSMAIIMDHAIAVPPLDFYDINDLKSYKWMDVITYLMYAPFSLLSVYLYDKFNPKGFYFTAYVIGWSIFCTVLEGFSVKFHVFTFYKWNLINSFSVYLVSTALLLSFFRFILRYFNENPKKPL